MFKNALLTMDNPTAEVVALAIELRRMRWQLYGSDAVAKLLQPYDLEVTGVAGPAEMNSTVWRDLAAVHPVFLAGVVNDPAYEAATQHVLGIIPFELVVVDFFPFDFQEGPGTYPLQRAFSLPQVTLTLAAAANWRHVGILTEVEQYAPVVAELEQNGLLSDQTRQELAGLATSHVSRTMGQVAGWFARQSGAV